MPKYLASIDLQQNQLVRARIENLASNPSTPVAGQVYFNTTTNRLRFYTGSAWVELDAAVESISANSPLSASVSGTGVTISIPAAAGPSTDGYMAGTDKAKLDAATNANTASTIVMRDASGNFSAGTITATLSGAAPAGSLSGNTLASGVTASSLTSVGTLTSLTMGGKITTVTPTTGTASVLLSPSSAVNPTSPVSGDLWNNSGTIKFYNGTATKDIAFTDSTMSGDTTGSAAKWTTARTITLSGDLSGSVSIDGSANVTLTATIAADSVALGTDTTGDYVASVAVSGTGLSVSGTGEGAAVTVTSNATNANTASTVVARDASGNFSAGTITANLTGNVTGTVSSLSNHTTDSLTEGTTNLYYTDTRVRANRLDQLATPNTNVSFGSNKITSLADPTNAQDAATKAYVDAARLGMDFKESVRAATTANITLSGTQTIDGVSVIAGDRVLVKDQSTGSQNGIYVVDASTWSRATDADTSADVTPGMFVFVEEGTANADTGWVLSTNGSITLGTTSLAFVQFSGAGQITAGNGLTKTGSSIDVVGTADRITANADSIDIASTYAGQTSITTLGTIGTGTWQGTAVAVAYGGTGASTSSGARSNLGATGKYAATITGTGSATSFTVTHNLGTSDVVVMVYDTLSGNSDVVYPEVQVTSTNAVTIVFDTAPVGGGTPQTYRVVVIG